MSSNDRVKVTLLGASGYSGNRGGSAPRRSSVRRDWPRLRPSTMPGARSPTSTAIWQESICPPFEELRPDFIKGRAEIVISCLPERTGGALIAELVASGAQVDRPLGGFSLQGPGGLSRDLRCGTSGSRAAQGGGLRAERVPSLRAARGASGRQIPDAIRPARCWRLLPLIRRDLIDPVVDRDRRQVRHHRRAPRGECGAAVRRSQRERPSLQRRDSSPHA